MLALTFALAATAIRDMAGERGWRGMASFGAVAPALAI